MATTSWDEVELGDWGGVCACYSLGLILQTLPRGATITLAVLISLQASLSLLDILSSC